MKLTISLVLIGSKSDGIMNVVLLLLLLLLLSLLFCFILGEEDEMRLPRRGGRALEGVVMPCFSSEYLLTPYK